MTRKKEEVMSQVTAPGQSHEPSLQTVEMVCEHLGELGLPVGPDTARELVRAILELEGTRVEAHVKDALERSLETIRIATQSALGVLASTERLPRPEVPPTPPTPVLDPPYTRKTPSHGVRGAAVRNPVSKRKSGEVSGERQRAQPPPSHTVEPRRPRDEFGPESSRPVFRRPRH
jgi:hypothetical protein